MTVESILREIAETLSYMWPTLTAAAILIVVGLWVLGRRP
jgi:hypothetical protein